MESQRSLLRHYWIHLILFLGILLVINHLASQHFLRVDLTADQIHTMSSVTRKSMQQLKRPLQVRVYFNDGLEAPYNNHKQALLDKLGEIQAISRGKMTVEVFNPDDDQSIGEEAKSLGLESIQYGFQKGNLREARTIFMGVVILYGERQIPVSPLVSPNTMEYELIRAIRVITGDPAKIKTIGYLVSEGEPDLDKFNAKSPLGQFRDRVRKRHKLVPIALGADGKPLESVDALFVMGPQAHMTPRAQYQLDQYLMSGRPASFFLSSYRPDFVSMRAVPVRHGLNGLIGHYGLQLNKDALVDRKFNEIIPVPVTQGDRTRQVKVNYPLIPFTTMINHGHLLGRQSQKMTLPFVSSMTAEEDPLPGIQIDTLIETSSNSGSVQGLRHIQPNVFKVPIPGEKPGPHLVGATITGRLSSFFLDKPVPPPAGMAPDDPRFNGDPTQTIIDGAPTRLLVISSAEFMANNIPFMLDVTDWMLDDSDLMEIRSKFTEPALMENPEGSRANLFRAVIAGGPGLLLGLLGLLVLWMSRRHS